MHNCSQQRHFDSSLKVTVAAGELSSTFFFRQESDRYDGFFLSLLGFILRRHSFLIHAWVQSVVLWIAEQRTQLAAAGVSLWEDFWIPAKVSGSGGNGDCGLCAGWYLSVCGSGSQGRQAERSKEGGGSSEVMSPGRKGGRRGDERVSRTSA